MIDSIGSSSHVLWVREGGVDVASPDDEIGILMEIGALDIQERVGQPSTTAIILTEDDDTKLLESLIFSSGFDAEHTIVQPYFGVTKPHNLRPLISMIKKSNATASVVIHRDRDYLDEGEIAAWKTEISKMKAEPFVTSGIDVESHFLSPEYLSICNPSITKDAFAELIDKCLAQEKEDAIESFVNGRINIARENKSGGSINHGGLAVEAQKTVEQNPRRFLRKKILRTLRLKTKTDYGASLRIGDQSPLLSIESLQQVAKKLKKP